MSSGVTPACKGTRDPFLGGGDKDAEDRVACLSTPGFSFPWPHMELQSILA